MYDVRDIQLLQETLVRYEHLINRPSLRELSSFCVLEPCSCNAPIQLIKIDTWPASDTPANFQFIFNALAAIKEVVGYLLSCNQSSQCIYVGIKGDCTYALNLLQEGLLTSFPNIEFQVLSNSSHILTTFFNPCLYPQLACVTVIPNTPLTTSLLTTFTNIMGSTSTYNFFFLACPYARCDLLNHLDELCEIYYILSTFNQTNINESNALAKNSASSRLHCETQTHGTSHTETNGSSMTHSNANYANAGISTGVPIPALNNQNLNFSYLLNKACSDIHGHTDSLANGNTFNHANAHTTSRVSGENQTNNHSMSYSLQNKCVQNALTTLSNIIIRIESLLKTTAFEYSAYFFSPSPETSTRAAYSFIGLAPDSSTYLGPSIVNLLDCSSPDYNLIFDNLAHFNVPRFYDSTTDQTLSPTSFIQSLELVNSFYLPISKLKEKE